MCTGFIEEGGAVIKMFWSWTEGFAARYCKLLNATALFPLS